MNATTRRQGGPGKPTQRSRPLKVIVIDDNVDHVTTTRLLLEAEGMETAGVSRATSALFEIEAFQPDVVLLDIGLPELDGFQIAQGIRQSIGANILVVAVTAYGSDLDKQRSKNAGFDQHLTKPIEGPMLVALLKLYAEQRGITRSAAVKYIADAKKPED